MSMPGCNFSEREMIFLFDLNENAMLDALRYSNKSKFINHERDTPNCTAKAVSVCGVHHITTWALRNIAWNVTLSSILINSNYRYNI
ncbi:unnamed protein product [Peronospora farinosa]|uniref:SET domain-containing protein n=1 Tax=Peronospora farinosa TaxID=134698 RepID=A0AAV0SRC2_9STRA|nr:unnamed protein product [Peronospora farinosa]